MRDEPSSTPPRRDILRTEHLQPRDFTIVESRPVLGPGFHQVSARFAERGRCAEHRAGRRCAALALARAGAADRMVGRHGDGAPIWPSGFVGAITHSGDFASACVASAEDIAGVGIDSERIVTNEVREEIERLVFRPGERAKLAFAGDLDEQEVLTVVFSAKESLYKCVFPIVHAFFDFQEAEVTALDRRSGALWLRLLRRFQELPEGIELRGKFVIERGVVHTAVELHRAVAGRDGGQARS